MISFILGFGDNTEKERATDISKLSLEERKDLPTNNLITERNLSVFDRRASKSAKCRNRKFTAKGIRNDMVLHKSKVIVVEKSSWKLTKLLSEREKNWNESQKAKAKQIEAKLVSLCVPWNTQGSCWLIVKVGLVLLHHQKR